MSGVSSPSGETAARDGRLLAGFLGDALRAIVGEPGAGGNKARQGLREICDERLAGCRRHVLPRQHHLADRREMAEPFGYAVQRETNDFGLRVLQKHETDFRTCHFGERG
jgi:hypothetical protein